MPRLSSYNADPKPQLGKVLLTKNANHQAVLMRTGAELSDLTAAWNLQLEVRPRGPVTILQVVYGGGLAPGPTTVFLLLFIEDYNSTQHTRVDRVLHANPILGAMRDIKENREGSVLASLSCRRKCHSQAT